MVGAQQCGLTAHVQERVLLPGKVGRRRVFGCGAAAYYYFNLGRVPGVQVAVAIYYSPLFIAEFPEGEGIATAAMGRKGM